MAPRQRNQSSYKRGADAPRNGNDNEPKKPQPDLRGAMNGVGIRRQPNGLAGLAWRKNKSRAIKSAAIEATRSTEGEVPCSGPNGPGAVCRPQAQPNL